MEVSHKNLSPDEIAKFLGKVQPSNKAISSLPETTPSHSKEIGVVGDSTVNVAVESPSTPIGECSTEQQEEYLNRAATHTNFTPLEFEDPIEMLYYLNEDVGTGITKLHDWQMVELLRICQKNKYSKAYPLELNICANNGSGKDAYINAPVPIYLSLTHIRHNSIITSSSAKQLDSQTESYIRTMAFNANIKLERDHGIKDAFLIKKGKIVCTLTGSVIKMFVSDEPGKVEGDHPFPDYPHSEMLVLVNEAKSITTPLYDAMSRWTGYSRWVEISSAGPPEGVFYNNCGKGIPFPQKYIPGKRFFRKVTAYDCPHITPEEIERKRAEWPDAKFKSIYLSEFVSDKDLVVISIDSIDKCLKEPPKELLGDKVGGLDLSLGGDETVFVVRQGNRITAIEHFRIKDSIVLKGHLQSLFIKYGFEKYKHKIHVDVGGLGQSIFRDLLSYGWNLAGYHNQSPPVINKGLYGNLGTDHWFHLNELICKKQIILGAISEESIRQLSRRHYIIPLNDRIRLMSKEDERAKMGNSPDHADAIVLAFCDYFPEGITKSSNDEGKTKAQTGTRLTQEELLKKMEEIRYSRQQEGSGRINQQGRGRTNQRSLINRSRELLTGAGIKLR